jgi:glutathione S-transferase
LASTCSQKVRLALAEKGLEWESRVVNLRGFEHLSPEFLRLNPDGLVPVLLHDGFMVRESSVINDYIDEVFPAPPLSLPGPQGRAQVGMWSRFIDDVTSPAIKKPSFAANMRPYLQTLPSDYIESVARRMPSRATGERWRKTAQEGIPQEELDQAHADLHRTLERMDAALAGSPWLTGERYTLADINMAPFVFRLDSLPGYALDRDWPRVADWLRRVQARPAFARARFVEQTTQPAVQPAVQPAEAGGAMKGWR